MPDDDTPLGTALLAADGIGLGASCDEPYFDRSLFEPFAGSVDMEAADADGLRELLSQPSGAFALAFERRRPFVPRFRTVRQYKAQRKGHRTRDREVPGWLERTVLPNVVVSRRRTERRSGSSTVAAPATLR